MTVNVLPLQRSLARVGAYLGRLDNIPGPLLCDALACALASHAPPQTGKSLAAAIPAAWWSTPNRVAMLYAMINAETGFRLIVENLDYNAAELCSTWPKRFSKDRLGLLNPAHFAGNPQLIAECVYGGRMGNGKPGTGDGFRFRGRSWVQLTGRAAYEQFGPLVGVDLANDPDQANDIMTAGRLAVAFMSFKARMLAAADAGNVAECRQIWNGGSVGLKVASDSFDKVRLLWGNP